MESMDSSSSTSVVKCCDCGCECSMINWSQSGADADMRSVKRKYEEFEGDGQFTIQSQNARVEIENECAALRETVSSQQEKIQALISELEEERNASSTSANEAMSMILRLQTEKAELDMEARQFKTFIEGKTVHDQQEMSELEELLNKKDHIIESLTCEVQAYKHKMMSYGLTETEIDELSVANEEKGTSPKTNVSENLESQPEPPDFDIYPPLKCNTNEYQTCPNVDENNVFEKVIVGQSPRLSVTRRECTTYSSNSIFAAVKEMGTDYGSSIRKTEYSHLDVSTNLRKVENACELEDDMSDRVYTIDSIHQGASVNGVTRHATYVGTSGNDYATTPRDLPNQSNDRDQEIKKLYARLQSLEADRETMRQSIISVGTDKAQLVLLKEIAENLCKEMNSSGVMPSQKKSATKPSSASIVRTVASLVKWKRRAQRCKYTFGLPPEDPGLVMLLERDPRRGLQRYLSSTNL